MKKGNFFNASMSRNLAKMLLLLAAVSMSFSAYSQDDDDPSDIIKPEEESDVGKLWLGFRGGVSASSFGDNTSSFDLMDGTGTLNSFTGGVFLKYQLFEWMAVQPGVMYLQAGANGVQYTEVNSTANFFSGPYTDATTRGEADVTGRMMLNMIDLPLNAVFTPKNFMPKVKPYFVFGPSFGFIINSRTREDKLLEFPGSGTSVSVTNTVDNTSNFRIFDFALNYGVGSRFNMFGHTGFLEVRYRWGISNISNFSQHRFDRPSSLTSKSFAPQDLTNHSLMLTTGIMIGLNDGGKKKKKDADMTAETE